jgi:basic membrane protein A
MKRRVLALVALAAVAVLTATAGAKTVVAKAGFKACWIYVGPHNDGGWSQAHDMGRLFAVKTLGSKADASEYKENVAEDKVAPVIDSMVNNDHCKIVFATSYGYWQAMKAAAAKYPTVKFEMATATYVSKNMAEYYGAGEDAIYLSGIAAGAAAPKGATIGYVAPFAIPEVIRHTNAFALGVQTVNPTAKVKVVWTNSWFSPPGERSAAQSLYKAGAKVLGQNVDSPATGQYAQSAGVPWVGYDSNAQKAAPKAWLTAAVYNWGPYYASRIKAAMNGTWKSGFIYLPMKSGFTTLAPYGKKVSPATRKLIVSGKWNEFTGPIYDQAGKLRIPKGKNVPVWNARNPSALSLYTMNFFVKGVEGSPTGK